MEATGDSLRFKVGPLTCSVGNSEEHSRFVSACAGDSVGSTSVGEDPVELTLVFESTHDGLEVRGQASLHWVGQCRRCLGMAEGDAITPISEIFAHDHGVLDADDQEASLMENGWIDLSDAVRDSVLLALPLSPLCSADCAGPSPDVFPVSTDGAIRQEGGDSAEPPLDPRWASLQELRLDPEEG